MPPEDIQGARTPNLQLHGNFSIEAYIQSKLTYDNSWPTSSNFSLFPYTLDFPSTQQCLLGGCPTGVYPKFIISPINNFVGANNIECNALAGCQIA